MFYIAWSYNEVIAGGNDEVVSAFIVIWSDLSLLQAEIPPESPVQSGRRQE